MALSCAVLAACSPTFNWRELAVDDSPLSVMLPCKPERGERNVPLAGRNVPLRVMGCEAGGGTFAVAVADVKDATLVPLAITHWRAATLAGMKGRWAALPARAASAAQSKGKGKSEDTDSMAEVVAKATGSLAGDGKIEYAVGQQPSGESVQMWVQWFSQGTQVFQAIYLSDKPAQVQLGIFMNGLRWSKRQ